MPNVPIPSAKYIAAKKLEQQERAASADMSSDDKPTEGKHAKHSDERRLRALSATLAAKTKLMKLLGKSNQSVMGLYNSPQDAVDEMLDTVALTNPAVRRLQDYKVIVAAQIHKDQVALISGGGSGHEPSHAGWVGDGMLTAAVAGAVFASPSTKEVLAAIMHVTGEAGCLVIVKNYTGDRLNFGLACEHAKTHGLAVELVVVGDDCALPHRTDGLAGRRGLAGTVFVHKIAGAAAAAGANLAEVAQIARKAAAAVGTMGVALRACRFPGSTERDERIQPGMMEMGLGIHGEPGAMTCPLKPVNDVVDQLLQMITSADEGRAYLCLSPSQRVALLVNNLGGSTPIEVSLATRRAIKTLTNNYHVQVCRCYSGTFMTALDMAGISISILKLDNETLSLLDAPAAPEAWPMYANVSDVPLVMTPILTDNANVSVNVPMESSSRPLLTIEQQRSVCSALQAAASAIVRLEPQLTMWDCQAGDGDCGTTLKAGAEAVLADCTSYPLDRPIALVQSIGRSLAGAMGGTSGVLYHIFISAAVAQLNAVQLASAPTAQVIAEAFVVGVEAVSCYGGATEGDRTMLDAMVPAAQAMRTAALGGASFAEAIHAAAAAAEAGAEKTKLMLGAAGRSSYVPADNLKGVPDPGAMAVAEWLLAIANACEPAPATLTTPSFSQDTLRHPEAVPSILARARTCLSRRTL